MEFVITKKAKRKAKRIREKTEKKWRPLILIKWFCLSISIISFLYGIFFPHTDSMTSTICGVLFALFLILAVFAKGILINLTSHWITTRLNERMWISEGKLYHVFQTAFASGINFRHADERGIMFIMNINTITDAIVDPNSKRVEFKANGKGIHYADLDQLRADREWDLNGFSAVFYDYTNPSLVQVLESEGVDFKEQTLDFAIRDTRV